MLTAKQSSEIPNGATTRLSGKPLPFFQCKFTLNQPGDVYEHEADAIADKVVNTAGNQAENQSFFKPVVSSIQRLCTHCEQENQLKRKDITGGGIVSDKMSEQLQISKGTGHGLDKETKHFMENGFGTDFSGVKIHTDEAAMQMSRDLNAKAFTTGNDIYFNKGEYNPSSTEGRHLLAHELTHTIQQAGMLHKRTEQNDKKHRQLSLQPPATSLSVQREDKAPLSASELTSRIARCIGIWETNRGRNDPAPKESTLDTVAGIHASMATIEQATMPYAISTIKAHKELRDAATPPLTEKELNDANAVCLAVITLLTLVSAAAGAGKTPDDFIKDNPDAISATGLSNDDVKTMFSAVTLQATLKAASAEVAAVKDQKEKKKKLQEKIDEISVTDRLGLGEGSLRTYINRSDTWGENRAAWQRKAVGKMADNIGGRIEAVTVSKNGTALAGFAIGSRVDAELAKDPVPSQDEIIKTVGQQNNPKEKDYGAHILETYNRLYP